MYTPPTISWSAVPELLALRPSNRRRVLVPLNKSNVYERVERGLSSARARGIDRWGIEPNSQQTLRMSSCDLGTKSSLGLNCYFTAVYISTKSNTRSCSASATDAASYPTYIYSYSEYQNTAPPIV